MFDYIKKYQSGGSLIDTDAMMDDLKVDPSFFKEGKYTSKGRRRLAAIQQIDDNQSKGLSYKIDDKSAKFSIVDKEGSRVDDSDGRGLATDENRFAISSSKRSRKEVSKAISGASKYIIKSSNKLNEKKDKPKAEDKAEDKAKVKAKVKAKAKVIEAGTEVVTTTTPATTPATTTATTAVATPAATPATTVPPQSNIYTDGLDKKWNTYSDVLDKNVAKLKTSVYGDKAFDLFTSKKATNPRLISKQVALLEAELDKRAVNKANGTEYKSENELSDDDLEEEIKNLKEGVSSSYSDQIKFSNFGTMSYLDDEIEKIKKTKFSKESDKLKVLRLIEGKKKALGSNYDNSGVFENYNNESFSKFYKNLPGFSGVDNQFYWDEDSKSILNRIATDAEEDKEFKEFDLTPPLSTDSTANVTVEPIKEQKKVIVEPIKKKLTGRIKGSDLFAPSPIKALFDRIGEWANGEDTSPKEEKIEEAIIPTKNLVERKAIIKERRLAAIKIRSISPAGAQSYEAALTQFYNTTDKIEREKAGKRMAELEKKYILNKKEEPKVKIKVRTAAQKYVDGLENKKPQNYYKNGGSLEPRLGKYVKGGVLKFQVGNKLPSFLKTSIDGSSTYQQLLAKQDQENRRLQKARDPATYSLLPKQAKPYKYDTSGNMSALTTPISNKFPVVVPTAVPQTLTTTPFLTEEQKEANNEANRVASMERILSRTGDQKLVAKKKSNKLYKQEGDVKTSEGKDILSLSRTGLNTPMGEIQYNDVAQFALALRAKNKKVGDLPLFQKKFVSSGSRNVLAARDMDKSQLDEAKRSISKMQSGYNGSDPVIAMISQRMAGEARSNANVKLTSQRAAGIRAEENRVSEQMEQKRTQQAANLRDRMSVTNENELLRVNAKVQEVVEKQRKESEFYNTLGSISSAMQGRTNAKTAGLKTLKAGINNQEYQAKIESEEKAVKFARTQLANANQLGTKAEITAARRALAEAITAKDLVISSGKSDLMDEADEIDRGFSLWRTKGKKLIPKK